ncbi:disintegrin and metalloproteinase domain-containing protein 30 [Leptonychotes weddellii]|uniref:Disintegrin and metalloproteinase domain-containing protein 30 n=1 Tax=Leptonychotes weddellii TaxID=9713 RepID=A0A2U3YXQ4_LEPWE|nr:disintegrin and metalloproteinase domain-containing protein 30 [Leptonychotes weddellii]
MRSVRTLLPKGRSLPVLVLVALLVHALGEDLIFHPEWGFESYEIIIPKKLSFRGGQQGAVQQVSYLLQVKGKKYILHLWPKRFLLPRNLKVFSFTEQEKLLEDHPYIPRDCNYIGLVEGTQDSEATLSTCTGSLRGILKIDEEHYQIEPLKASSSFEHVMYLLKKEDRFQNQTCGLINDELEKQMAQSEIMVRLRDYHGSYKHQKYMELALVFDYSRFLFSDSNITRVIQDAILLTGVMDTFFKDISMRLQLQGVEIWTNNDKFNIHHMTSQELLNSFLKYSTTTLSGRVSADWAHLYITGAFTHALGWAYIGGICKAKYSGSISSFPNLNILEASRLSAHELGHGVGMKHDTEYCQCRGKRTCIMGTGSSGFSNCSYSEYLSHINSGGECLNNIPGLGYVVERCGNKIVEGNEECDCGSREDCKKDRCCEPDCKLARTANCSTGLCCHKCRFRPLGYICRKEDNECDLAEYCNGISHFCPDDTFKHDGTLCKGNSMCFKKRCHSRYTQCQNIFGPDAREAPDQCYRIVNLVGDQYGNCGIIGGKTYVACARENVKCGRIQCINVKSIPDMPEHSILISTHLREENLMCWGIGYHTSLTPSGIPDVGEIFDGTPCGFEQLCINRTCVHTSVLKPDCFPKKCNNRGICNNKKNCHCGYGWAPPFCEEQGYGGSIDSGPTKELKEEVPAPVQVLSIMLMRLIFLIISVIAVFFRSLIEQFINPTPRETPPINIPNK